MKIVSASQARVEPNRSLFRQNHVATPFGSRKPLIHLSQLSIVLATGVCDTQKVHDIFSP